MKIKIEFENNNAAFDDNGINEYGHVMSQVVNRIYDEEPGVFTLRDSNGNNVGIVKLSVG